MIRCLILTSDAISKTLLEKLTSDAGLMSVVGVTPETAIANQFIAEKKVDVVFADFDQEDGTPLLRETNFPLLIVLSASTEAAKTAFERDADYFLQKPLSRAKFNASLERIKQRLAKLDLPIVQTGDVMYLKSENRILAIRRSDIISSEKTPEGERITTPTGTYLIQPE